MHLGQSNSGLGPNTRTWKRLQVQTKVMGTVSPNDVGVGTKRKHKANLNFFECFESPELKKRKGDDEVLVVSDLLKNEFRTAGSNEYFKLELSGAWEPPHSSGSTEQCGERSSQLSLPYGD